MCECRVCKLSEYLRENYGEKFCDYYENCGLLLEGETKHESAYWKCLFENHFNHEMIDKVYQLWKKMPV